MAFIKKNVPIAIVILLLLLVSGFVGFAAYYQKTYSDLDSQKEQYLGELDQLKANLSNQRAQLEKTFSELQLQVAGAQKTETEYLGLLSEKKKTEGQLASTQGQLSSTKNELGSTISSLRETESKLADVSQKYNAAQGQISSLNSQVSSKNTKIDNMCSRLRGFDPQDPC